MCLLTNDDIHRIREEHSDKTKNMSFEEYSKNLNCEIEPIIERLRLLSIEKSVS